MEGGGGLKSHCAGRFEASASDAHARRPFSECPPGSAHSGNKVRRYSASEPRGAHACTLRGPGRAHEQRKER
eukprot:5326261-Pyramimonas_sp.AAC.1